MIDGGLFRPVAGFGRAWSQYGRSPPSFPILPFIIFPSHPALPANRESGGPPQKNFKFNIVGNEFLAHIWDKKLLFMVKAT